MFRQIVESIFRGILSYYSTFKVTGQSHLPDGPYILCSNHLSHADSMFLMLGVNESLDGMGFVAAYDYWFLNRIRHFLFGSVMHLIPIDRRAKAERAVSFSDTVSACRAFLDGRFGRKIVFYGTGSRDKGAVKVKPGVVLLAASLGIPIVPVRLMGTDVFFGKRSKWFRKCEVSMTIFSPILVDLDRDSGTGQFSQVGVDGVCGAIEKVLRCSVL